METMSISEYNRLVNKGLRISADECVLRNTLSNAAGMHFEKDILRGCEKYRQQGIAVINKVAEPYRVLRNNRDGSFYGRHTGKAEPDFKGVLIGGRAVAFEAKSTSKTRIQKSAVTVEQAEWLEEQFNMGAVAFVCVFIREWVFSVPWQVWRDMKVIYGKRYLLPDDIKRFRVDYHPDGVRFLEYVDGGDYLGLRECVAVGEKEEL